MLDFLSFKKKDTSFLGIDLGTNGVKVVQLGFEGGMAKLENYIIVENIELQEVGGQRINEHISNMPINKIASSLTEIIKETGITAKKVAMSAPISSAFSSVVYLPNMTDDEIPKAVNFEARRYIPIPLSEVVFGWNVISREEAMEKNKNGKSLRGNSKIKVLLIAIPKEVINKYASVAKLLKLELVALETESFSLARSLIGKRKGTFTIIDIGDRSTDITIVENGNVLLCHSVSGIGGLEITKIISHGLNIDFQRAEFLKKDMGSKFKSSEKNISEIILPIVSVIISETKKINSTYFRTSKKEIQKIILTGGSSNIAELVNSIYDGLKIAVEIGNPWENIVYNKILSEKLKQLSPNFSVAVGLALRGFEGRIFKNLSDSN